MRFPFLDLATVNAPYMDEIQQRVAGVVASGRYVGGEEVEELEMRLKALTGAEYAIGVSNGLDALRLILKAYIQLKRLNPGDEIIVPANTYIASVLAISDAGLVPVLADPDILTSNLEMEMLRAYITPETRAIMPVHLYGRVCWETEIERLAKEFNLLIIEDNAQAIGASTVTEDRGRVTTGALGDAAGFSFYPTKNIGAMGDAGAVTTSDPDLARTVRALANYGADRRYHNIYKGFNCRLDPIQAAVLNVKLPHVDEENAYRRHLAEIYCNNIANPAVRLPLIPDDPNEIVWHQFVVHISSKEISNEFDTIARDNFAEALTHAGVGWDMHYATPPHRQPCYQEIYGCWDLPVTDILAASCLSLPISRCTSPDDAAEISRIINNIS